MNRRIEILKYWISRSNTNVKLFDLLNVIFGKKIKNKAKKYISDISKTEQYYEIKFKDISKTLFFPSSMPLSSLYQVIEESMNPKDWHYFEIPQTIVEKNDIVIDCGAAEGLFSFLVSLKCSKVYAIEPLPLFINALTKTFDQVSNVEIVPMALSNVSGTGYLSNNGIASMVSEKGEIPITLQTIDNLFFEKGKIVNYIKADLEGFEIQMLEGAKNTIMHNKPKIAITTYHNKDHAKQIEKILKEFNPAYNFITKGIEPWSGGPVTLHAWNNSN
jgi:FkbM family methyltransferase